LEERKSNREDISIVLNGLFFYGSANLKN